MPVIRFSSDVWALPSESLRKMRISSSPSVFSSTYFLEGLQADVLGTVGRAGFVDLQHSGVGVGRDTSDQEDRHQNWKRDSPHHLDFPPPYRLLRNACRLTRRWVLRVRQGRIHYTSRRTTRHRRSCGRLRSVLAGPEISPIPGLRTRTGETCGPAGSIDHAHVRPRAFPPVGLAP